MNELTAYCASGLRSSSGSVFYDICISSVLVNGGSVFGGGSGSTLICVGELMLCMGTVYARPQCECWSCVITVRAEVLA